MAEFPGGGVLGPVGAIVSAIGSLIGSFVGITAARLFEFLKLLKDYVLKLAQQTLIGMFRTARAVARVLRALAELAAHGVKAAAQWAYREIVRLHDFLKAKFGPVLRWLRELKQHIRDIYDKWVRPVVDAIQFIRQLNAILELFHISLLKKLDATLATIERRIEDPFVKLNQWITWAENQFDRIIGLDGIFQKVTLVKSMSRYAPAWLRIATAARSQDISGDAGARLERSVTVQPVGDLIGAISAYMDGDSNDVGDVITAAVNRGAALFDDLG